MNPSPFSLVACVSVRADDDGPIDVGAGGQGHPPGGLSAAPTHDGS